MRAACIQLNSGIDINANIAAATMLIRQAAHDGAQLISTPEMTHILQKSSADLFSKIQLEDDDEGVKHFSALAEELGIYLHIGSLAIKTEEARAANRSFFFGPDGHIMARYDKIHLFDVTVSKTESWMESRVYDAGDKAITANAGTLKLGLSICYDIRFPHLYRDYAQAGANVMMIPAAFTRPTGEAHWEALLRARAIETGSYVMAAAQGGEHEDGRATWGYSMIIDPWGDVLARLDHDKPGFLIADIDPEASAAARRRIPAWHHDPTFETPS